MRKRKHITLNQKEKKDWENYVPFSICDIKEECHDIRIHGKIFEIENRTLRTGKDIQTLWIADDDDAIIMKRFERGSSNKRSVKRNFQRGLCCCVWKSGIRFLFQRTCIYAGCITESGRS